MCDGSLFFNDRKRRMSSEDRQLLDSCENTILLIDGDEYLGGGERRELGRRLGKMDGNLRELWLECLDLGRKQEFN